jgi:tripartite-type tricarboxylate transporter receptor subunit TctC
MAFTIEGEATMTVNASVPARDVKEFIAWARSQGTSINYGSPGNGTHHHLYMEQLRLMAAADLMGGQISAMVVPMGAALAMSKDNKVRLLGGSTIQRLPLTPNLPTMHEQGLTGFDAEGLFTGVEVKASTPEEAERLARAELERMEKLVKAANIKAD